MFLRLWVFLVAVVVSGVCAAQGVGGVIEAKGAGKAPNTEATYVAMRKVLPSGDGVKVKDLTLVRQGGTFHFAKGTFYFYGSVEGKVTGAVFEGDGNFSLAPKAVSEQKSLALLTKSNTMSENFRSLVLRFTDGTADEIQKASVGPDGAATSDAVSAATKLQNAFRKKIHDNLELRLLEDTFRTEPGEFFLASFRMEGLFTGRNVLFVVDAEGTPDAAPDEVELSTWDEDTGAQTWVAYQMDGSHEGHGVLLHVSAQKLDVTFEKSGMMHASAETTLTAKRDGQRVVPLQLYPTLRVTGVFSEAGEPLEFVQENKDDDPDFAVILPAAMKSGEAMRILTKYDGKDVVLRGGSGVYMLNSGARDRWYPADHESFGAFASYRMTFHLPKDLQIVATGKQVSLENEPGGGKKAIWATDTPIAVAGFNLGDFKTKEMKTPDGFTVTAYANEKLPDVIEQLKEALQPSTPDPNHTEGQDTMSLGSLSTTDALQNEAQQGIAAIQVYSNFFGKLPFDHLALTQQNACNFGQSWPMLVYLPFCSFWDSTVQHELGLDRGRGGFSFWHHVTAHEVAHQWWGQEVGFNSYRDQWMSEGFAEFSASLYVAATNKNLDEFHKFWKEEKDNLLLRTPEGKRPIDVGALTMGHRVANEKTGDIYQNLIYSKGAYVMHMLQVLFWTPKEGDGPFKNSMQQFVKEYAGKAATTEDFKASFEKSMPKWMDILHNGKLDWFFNEWVYGTELPHYEITSDFTVDANGETSVHFKVTQSKVSDDFLMVIPVYLQMADGKVARMSNVGIKGNGDSEHTVKLGKLPSPGKKMLLNYNEDLLSD